MDDSALWLGPLCAFLSSCTWAIGSAHYSQISRTFTPFQINLTRALFSLPLFIAAAFITAGSIQGGFASFGELELRHLGWFTLSMFASYGLGDVFFLWSTQSLGVPGALAIASSYPVLTSLGQLIFQGAVWPPLRYLGLVLAVGGIIAVILSQKAPVVADDALNPGISSRLRKRSVGIVLAFLTAGCWATNGFAVARGGVGLDPAVGSALRMVIAMGLSSFLGLILLRKPVRPLPRGTVRRFAWVFVLEAFLGTYFFMFGLSHSDLVVGVTLTALAPVISVPVSLALRLERFSWLRTCGVLTSVVGVILLMRTPA